MPLAEGQVQIRDLVMGAGTQFRFVTHFDPFGRTVRADQGGPRAWQHGNWSGVEWQAEAVIPMKLVILGNGTADYVARQKELSAAFAAIGDSGQDVPLTFTVGGTEYLMAGRPRMVEPDRRLTDGTAWVSAAFVALDPRIYAGVLSSTGLVGLTQFAAGLVVPLSVPFHLAGTLSGGTTTLVNAGTTATGLVVRIDGPVDTPRLALQAPDGTTQQLQFDLSLAAGQWLDVDSVSRTALLNGLASSNQFGVAMWAWDQYPLQAGTSRLRFFAESFTAATVSATWRSAWW
jgi:hypothetical protein